MQEDAVALLSRGVINVMRHLEMIESVADATATANDEARMTNDETNPKSKIQNIAGSNMATTLLTKFEWLYTKSTGVWYPKVAPGDAVGEGEQIGDGRRFVWRHSGRNCFAGERRCTFPDDQSIRAREWVTHGNRSGIRSDQSV